MIKKILIVLIFLVSITDLLYGHELIDKGSIRGRVFDQATKQPIEFSNIVLFLQKDSSQITGTVTDKNGIFNLNNIGYGNYYLFVRFMGYERKVFNNIRISKIKLKHDLGNIYLKPTEITLQNIVVEGQRSPITYELDKKVIDVSKMNTAMSGTAADVLENVPSVRVDIDGNVSLRGSSNFQVLINGKPSVMDAQDALQQIPASSIKNIELITNPSAKYDASGTAGIINIVLKKNSNLGLSGIVNIMGGLNDKYGGNFIFQYKTPSINYNFGVDYNRRFFPGTNSQDKQFILGDNTSYLNSDGNMVWGRTISGVRGGLDFGFGESNNLSLGGRYGSRSFLRNSTLNYNQWSRTDPQKLYYLNNTNHDHSGDFYDLNSNYIHNFNQNGHKLTTEIFYRHRNNNEASNSYATQSSNLINGTKTTEQGPESEIRGKMDYILPFNNQENFSAGMEYFSRLEKDINKLYIYDSTNKFYNYQSQYSHTNDFNRTRFAAYTMFSNKWDSLGIQAGFRTEYTYQLVKLADTDQQFSLSRWDYFPSIHSSYNLAGGTQVMASYTRRIDRPDGGDLEPFYTWFDANDVRIGNPSVKPELIDSYELGWQTFFGKVSFSNDFYYRFTHDKRQDINSVYAENVTLRTVANVGTDQSLGAEFMVMFNPVEFWQFNLMGDVYDYKISGAIFNQSFARESFNWRIKNNNVFKITPSTELQLNTRYYSPSVNAQGKWEGFFTTDMAVKQNFLDKNLSLTLQVRDLLHTGKREFITQGTDFYNHSYFTRQSPMVMLNIKFNFNNYKEQNQPDNSSQDVNNNPGE
ncbi:MAG: outer membrane beta-barrel family protein [Ignavibacteriaceae bacterium]